MTMLIIWGAIICGMIAGIWESIGKPSRTKYNAKLQEPPAELENDDISYLTRLERVENYDKQIEGYTHLIRLLDKEYLTETDTKKKAAILSKQLTTLEKLNKTIEKREKLDL